MPITQSSSGKDCKKHGRREVQTDQVIPNPI
jgi:hypothetical protein